MLNYLNGKYIKAFYKVDKTGTGWKVTFTESKFIDLHKLDENSVEEFEVHANSVVVVKPGQWLEYRNLDYFGPFTRIRELDHRTNLQRNYVDSLKKNIPAYAIDKTSIDHSWDVRFFNGNWRVRVQPLGKFYGGFIDFLVVLKPGEYVERENADNSFTLLKDLDRR